MEKYKVLRFILPFLLLAMLSVGGSILSFLIFPSLAFMFAFLVNEEKIKPEIRTAAVGLCLFLIFLSWHYIQYDKLPFMFAFIYTLALMAGMEAWRFTVSANVNIWGLMNLVVFWIAIEFIMLLWLPFDTSGWMLGVPLINAFAEGGWMAYTGKAGYSLWALLGGLLLFKSFERGKIFIPALAGALLLMVIPALINFNENGTKDFYAQGEWIGRTCMWVSILILIYSFVKRKTK